LRLHSEIMIKQQSNWFTSWFNTPYYHILYKDRDYNEAGVFMTNITNYLNFPENANILDLACGRGRHSLYLSKLGYNVTGADLSEDSIAFAKQFENEQLRFEVHDMTVPFGKTFDGVFNLFTSFGYFDDEADNIKTLQAIKTNLNDNGFAVLDFMNVDVVIPNLIPFETKEIDGITFHIKRYFENGFIYKDISFQHDEKDYNFTERVRAFTLNDFEDMFEKLDIYLLDVFGDYQLNKYYKNRSERLIMIFK
jgi:SAM-dependent methyltransferase